MAIIWVKAEASAVPPSIKRFGVMTTAPWLTLIGIDAGGFTSLSPDARSAVNAASIIMGPARHLSMLPPLSGEKLPWPTPFSAGIDFILSHRGKPLVVLLSGDPFWFGAGSQVVKKLDQSEWCALPGQSCFSLAASFLGWSLNTTTVLGLHAAPLSRLRPYLYPGRRIMVTLREGAAVQQLANYLTGTGFGDSLIWVLESLGAQEKRSTSFQARTGSRIDFRHPLMACVNVAGSGKTIPQTPGLADDWFVSDGQITKQPVRALTLSALAPKAGQHLWDLGAGAGSVSIEWLLSGPDMRASAVEKNRARVENIRRNAGVLGVDWLNIIESENRAALESLERPDAIFIGGGLREDFFCDLWTIIPSGTRVVANGVTIETDRILTSSQEKFGGKLMRFELSQLNEIGRMKGWKGAYPITQWTVIR